MREIQKDPPKSSFAQEMIKRNILDADYLLNKTYPLVKDEKMFLEVVRHLFYASKNLLDFTLLYAHEQDQISRVPKNHFEKLNLISNWPVKGQKTFNQEYLKDLADLYWKLKVLEDEKKNDLISFKRKQNYVICDKNYKVEQISFSSLNDLLQKSKCLLVIATQMSRS
ncbi:MAG: hypothetical protein ABIG93_04120 [archaeon]|nr:hypothetical protein [Nanoarchaeota archaeon]